MANSGSGSYKNAIIAAYPEVPFELSKFGRFSVCEFSFVSGVGGVGLRS